MITCPSCGFNQNPETALFCARCAAPLEGAPALDAMMRGQPLAAGTMLQNKYTVLRELSRGGMGAVYLAQDTKLFNKPCVVKEMLPFYTNDDERRVVERNFEREARTLAALSHPGVPEIYDYFIEDDRYYLVMAFVEGEDLGAILEARGQAFTEEEVIRYGLQLARILAYLAILNPPIIHRDIKPANILLEKSTGQVKLVDFGIARSSIRSERLDATGSMIMGTRGYAPPEQYSGDTTTASDIYALGATLHHLATGKHPLRGGTTLRSVRELRPEISPALDALLTEMVRMDPDLRPDAAQVKERFERLSGTQVAKNAFVMRNGAEVYSVGELIQACEQAPDAGRHHLMAGHLKEWFLAQNRHDWAVLAEQCVTQAPDDKVALEWFLRGLDKELPLPELALEELTIDFGEVERDASYSFLAPYTNRTRGYLIVAAGSLQPWLAVESAYTGCYPGEQGQVQVTLDTRNMPAGSYSRDALGLAWEGGQCQVAVAFTVLWPPGGALAPEELDFGAVLEGEAPVVRELVLQSTGGSDWIGRLHTDNPWLSVNGSTFRIASQAQLRVQMVLHPARLAAGVPYSGAISLISNGGTQAIPVRAQVAKRWYLGGPRVRRWLAFLGITLLSVGGLGFGMARLAQAILALPKPAPGDLYGALIGLAGWLLGLLVAGTFVPSLDELENFHHGGDLGLDLPVARFRRERALAFVTIGAVAGLVIGLAFARGAPPGPQKGLWALAGLLLGALSGLGAVAGSSDALRGARAAPGLLWLARHPVGTALGRTALASLALSLLAAMLARGWNAPLFGSAALGAWAGLLATSDGYPFWPRRAQQMLAVARPAVQTVLLAYGLYLLATQLTWNSTVAWSAWWRSGVSSIFNQPLRIMAPVIALLLGTGLGVLTHDEVGFEPKRQLRQAAPLAVVLMFVAAVLLWALSALLRPLIGAAAGWLSMAATLAAVAVLALGLTGRSRAIRDRIESTRSAADRWVRQFRIPDQAQELAARGTQPLRWLSGAGQGRAGAEARTGQAGSHALGLAVAIVAAMQIAPLLVRLFGTLFWVIALGAAVAAGLWWLQRRGATRPAQGGVQ